MQYSYTITTDFFVTLLALSQSDTTKTHIAIQTSYLDIAPSKQELSLLLDFDT